MVPARLWTALSPRYRRRGWRMGKLARRIGLNGWRYTLRDEGLRQVGPALDAYLRLVRD